MASLDVSENSLTGDGDNITTGLQQIGSSLRVLAMNSCGLTAWPLAGLPLGCLPALHTLELRFNVLGGCPDSGLAACPRLKSLDLSGRLVMGRGGDLDGVRCWVQNATGGIK